MKQVGEKQIDVTIKRLVKRLDNFLAVSRSPIINIIICTIILGIGAVLFIIADYIFRPQVDPAFIIEIPNINVTITDVIFRGFVGHPIIVTLIVFFLGLPIVALIFTALLTLLGKIFEENRDSFKTNFNKNYTAMIYSLTPAILLSWQILVPSSINVLLDFFMGILQLSLIYTYERQKKTGLTRSTITVIATYLIFVNIALVINTFFLTQATFFPL